MGVDINPVQTEAMSDSEADSPMEELMKAQRKEKKELQVMNTLLGQLLKVTFLDFRQRSRHSRKLLQKVIRRRKKLPRRLHEWKRTWSRNMRQKCLR